MEPGPDVEKRANTAVHVRVPIRWPCDARKQTEERALAGTVGADEAYRLAFPDVERHVRESVQPSWSLGNGIPFRKASGQNRRRGHQMTSGRSRDARA